VARAVGGGLGVVLCVFSRLTMALAVGVSMPAAVTVKVAFDVE
jgi:hypothetical protein